METDRLANRKFGIVSILFVSAILMTATLANSSAFAAKQTPLDGDAREAKFNQLYQDDAEFKQIVDTYREISTKEEALAQADWDQLKTLFDSINIKMDGKTLTEEEWKNYMPLFKEAIISKRATTALKSQPSNEVTGSASTSLLTLVDTDYMPRLYQPTIDINGGSHGSHTHSGGNGFQKYYVKTFDETVYGYTLTGKMIYEVTLVFADEDCFFAGSNFCDTAHDNQRLSDWGRMKDLESFFIVVDKSTGNVDGSVNLG